MTKYVFYFTFVKTIQKYSSLKLTGLITFGLGMSHWGYGSYKVCSVDLDIVNSCIFVTQCKVSALGPKVCIDVAMCDQVYKVRL